MTREGGTLLDILLNAGLQLDNITWIQVSGFEAETGIRGDQPEEPDIVQEYKVRKRNEDRTCIFLSIADIPDAPKVSLPQPVTTHWSTT